MSAQQGNGHTMSQQSAEEWEDMDPKTQDEIKARLIAVCDSKATAPTHRHVVMAPTGRRGRPFTGFEQSI